MPSVDGVFATTRWSVVLVAGEDSLAGREALETLCRAYWFPVYALVRRRGFEPETARDFTQEFFARLLAQEGLRKARRERGRFRSFLAQSVRNFLADEWDKAQARKRGGGVAVLSLDAEDAEGRYHDAAHEATPDREFDRQWAQQILAAARARLEAEFRQLGREELLAILDRTGDPGAAPLAREAERLGQPVNTLKSHLHRARRRHAELIREVIAETVDTPAEVEEELRQLLAAIAG